LILGIGFIFLIKLIYRVLICIFQQFVRLSGAMRKDNLFTDSSAPSLQKLFHALSTIPTPAKTPVRPISGLANRLVGQPRF
jgi:hypothetical protein